MLYYHIRNTYPGAVQYCIV